MINLRTNHGCSHEIHRKRTKNMTKIHRKKTHIVQYYDDGHVMNSQTLTKNACKKIEYLNNSVFMRWYNVHG